MFNVSQLRPGKLIDSSYSLATARADHQGTHSFHLYCFHPKENVFMLLQRDFLPKQNLLMNDGELYPNGGILQSFNSMPVIFLFSPCCNMIKAFFKRKVLPLTTHSM